MENERESRGQGGKWRMSKREFSRGVHRILCYEAFTGFGSTPFSSSPYLVVSRKNIEY